jgi:hypothetical protein
MTIIPTITSVADDSSDRDIEIIEEEEEKKTEAENIR